LAPEEDWFHGPFQQDRIAFGFGALSKTVMKSAFFHRNLRHLGLISVNRIAANLGYSKSCKISPNHNAANNITGHFSPAIQANAGTYQFHTNQEQA
jgi:hypothetical protein